MRLICPILLAALVFNAGCITAVHKVEQAIRRSTADDDDDNRPSGRRELIRPVPAMAGGDVNVRPGHPRLFVSTDWPAATDDVSRDWQAKLRKRADDNLNGTPIAYSASKLLIRSRDALKKISLSAGVYRFTHDPKYAEAGKRELLNVCSFQDWQPNDFLATSEMMTAVSIGYDWLYDALSPVERRKVVAAIGSLGLRPALQAYASQGGWTRAQHNWNLVCNGGVIVASLAIAEEDPTLAKKSLALALDSIRYGLSAYDEHGGTAEGPMYHSYATRYLTFAAAAMKTAANDDRLVYAAHANESAAANWMYAGDYRLAMTASNGKSANFGDSSETIGNTAWMFWLSRAFGDTGFVASEYFDFQTKADNDDPSAFDLLWRSVPGPIVAARRPHEPDRNVGNLMLTEFDTAVVLRDNDLQTFLAVRTGGTADHHSHLDLGHFVLDLGGERFAQDLGADNYGLPGYLGPRRADYLRSSTPGHNTLTIGEASQPLDADAKTTAHRYKDGPVVKVDLTEAYPGAKSIVRTLFLNTTGAKYAAQITDEISLSRSATIVWHLHTAATVTPTKTGATLQSNGKQVQLKIVEPADAKLTVEPDVTRPPQQPVEGSNHVRIKVKVDREAKIVVEFRSMTP